MIDMTKKIVSAGLSLLITGSLLLAACSSPSPTPAETLDANAVYTQAAGTVQAGLEQTQAAKPPATATPEVTPTFDPTIGAALTAVAGLTATAQSQVAGQPTTAVTPLAGAGTQAVGAAPTTQITPLIQATTASGGSAPPAAASGDKAEWMANFPADGTQITKSASWDQRVTIKNTGTTTWTSQYAMKFFGGDQMGGPTDFYIVGEVKPGDSYTFAFTMKAPATAGARKGVWVMQNAEGANFYTFDIQLEIID
jgi:hypothetical protein